ncbi:hypothetical protein [Edaphobacter bradus]|uniref:hypothetical protein n=1 Tax=Edaphobacter bradus TaxID=2259016 RepID=UPI0021DFD4EE|nr:hypothetical protein [Edaphobacter bradus]
MRIPFPVHIPLWGATGFAAFLFAVQLRQGTSLLFALCCFLFICIATLAFNLAGGFSRPSGSYVFFYATLCVIVGLCWKAYLGEPADSNLLAPQLTIEVFLGGITAMYGAVFISRRLSSRHGLLQNLVNDNNMQNATVGCMVAGFLISVVLIGTRTVNGSVLSALVQINRFFPMAIILGVIYAIRRSGGTRSVNLPVLLSAGAIFIQGILGFSKEGIFTPVLCWAIAAGSQRYKVSLYQLIGGVAVVALMVMYLVPYSQYGRNLRFDGWTFSQNVDTSLELLSNLGDVREKYKESSAGDYTENSVQSYYFNTPQGFFDRLHMIAPDDSLIDGTERKGPFGLYPIIAGFENLVPHVFWPNKPAIMFGNIYAREIGGLPENDYTTGIAFSPSGDAYHIARWVGVFLIAPILWIGLFTLFDSLCGDTRTSPWGLLIMALFAHTAPEGMLGGVIYSYGFVTMGLLFAALSAAYVMPIFGTLVKGPEKTRLRRSRLLRGAVRRSQAAWAGGESSLQG